MDWIALISDLRKRGVNQSQIADLCDCAQSTISVLSTGQVKRPSFEIGQALIDLHRATPSKLRRLAAAAQTKAGA